MNNPEYILTDEMATVVAATKTKLGLQVLNFQYGYIEELNETLKQMEGDPSSYDKKMPLVWLAEPFRITRGEIGIYGNTQVDLYIFNHTTKDWKATDRMTNNYKPVLYPIYRELLNQIVLSVVFDHTQVEDMQHEVVKGYYWGEDQKKVLYDAVDCLIAGSLKLRISDNPNYTTFSNI
jgi:hypothetical protein